MADGIIIVDARHWLDENGELPHDAPPALFRNALRMAQCIEYGGPSPKSHLVPTLVQCRRRPQGVACRGTLMVVKTDEDELHAFCELCDSHEFLISNWQTSLWADGPPTPLPVKLRQPITDEDLPLDVADMLSHALNELRCTLSVAEVQQMIATADAPGTVMQRVIEHSAVGGTSKAQMLADTIIRAWNATPRPELDGQTPTQVYENPQPGTPVATPPKVGRNEPCSCGSGRKYKKCCGTLH